MQSPARTLGATYARHWKDANLKTGANYVLFDMTGEVLSRARHVIVHSNFARNKLIAVYGESVGARIAVIPHFAKQLAVTAGLQARRALGIDPDETVILTSGFATRAKRFDWLIEALDQLQQRGHRFRWVHAGEERANEYPLSRAIQARPGLAERCEVTGYLADDKLDCYIAAADIVVNLRFPSVGESSGTLARAFSAGRCCIVSDTAAYAELPREAVVHVPVFDTVAALVCALDQLVGDRTLRQTFGARARQYARKCLTLESIAKRYLEVVAESYVVDRQPDDIRVADPSPVSLWTTETSRLEFEIDDPPHDLADTLGPKARELDLTLWFSSSAQFAAAVMERPELVHSMLGPHVEIDGLKFVVDGVTAGDRIGIRLIGRTCG
jgi:glycosyltransferase involved in cell wall biosynthesis